MSRFYQTYLSWHRGSIWPGDDAFQFKLTATFAYQFAGPFGSIGIHKDIERVILEYGAARKTRIILPGPRSRGVIPG